MLNWQRSPAEAQLANFLRSQLAEGRWVGRMPGVIRLADELGVARNTVEGALKRLEREGVLIPQGRGRGRVIRLEAAHAPGRMRVAILRSDPSGLIDSHLVELQHVLQDAGLTVVPVETGGEAGRLEALVRQTKVEAWVVAAGSRGILSWFVDRNIPVFALFGRRRDLAIAGGGPAKADAFRQVVRELAALGHRRIVLLALKARRLPEPGLPERAFLEELQAQRIVAGPYHLPDWEENPEDLRRLLSSYFRLTPPTAFLVDEAWLFHAVKHHLASEGILCPQDVSLICTDPDPTFAWCRPTIAHIRWDRGPLQRRILRWLANVRAGNTDLAQMEVAAEFIPGGTIGPAP